MRWTRFSNLRRHVTLCLMVAMLTAANGTWATESNTQPPTVPELVHLALPGAVLSGSGQLRFFGLHIYDAQLWVKQGFDANNYGAHPLILELTYQRSFTGAEIAKRSVDEIKRQRSLTPEQAEGWRLALAALLPDVQAGERLTGLYQPELGMRLWHGNQALGITEDIELARLFFGIWLSTSTSEPSLRSKLLGAYNP